MKRSIKVLAAAVIAVFTASSFVSCGGGGGGDDAVATAPGAPGSVQAIVGDTRVAVSWVAVSGASSYTLYWSGTSGVTTSSTDKVTGITTGSYTHSSRTNGTTYYYIVTAVNSVGEGTASSEVSGAPKAATGAAGAAAANYSYDGTMGQAATYAKLNEVTISSKVSIDDDSEPAQNRYAIEGLTYTDGGTWTATGSNSEAVSITFWDASSNPDDPSPITVDISDWANYSPGSQLTDLYDSNTQALDSSKVKMKIKVVVNTSGLSGSLSEVDTTLTTGLIPLDDTATASYTLTGTGTATLANNDTITLLRMTITASNRGTTIVGSSTTNIPIDGDTYTIVCTVLNQTGCQTNVVTKDGDTVGTVAMEGSLLVFTDSDGNKTLLN